MNKIVIDIPTFLRLLELAREEVEEDAELHFIADIVAKISDEKTVTMQDYENIYNYSIEQNKEEKLKRIRELSGLQ